MPQGTVKNYDDNTRSGSLLMDDRTVVAIDAASVADPAILSLRLGQRVKFEVHDTDAGPTARALRLVTFE